MRIIGGQAAGMTLQSPPGPVRPTSGRVRESLFNILEPIAGDRVVDLFAGSGALGLEALSRHAAEVVWIERHARTSTILQHNANRVISALTPPPPATRVLTADVRRTARLLPGFRPDLVFADPPYRPGHGELGGPELLRIEDFHTWLADGFLVLEQARQPLLDLPDSPRWKLLRHNTYGDTAVYFLEPVRG